MNQYIAKAPARANIIGEHTDYATNQGHVLPTPLPFHTTVSIQETAGAAGHLTIQSENYGNQRHERNLSDEPRHHWTDYVVGSARVMSRKVRLPALELKIKSNVPIGSGISSSAALCVATVRALKALTAVDVDDKQIALMAHEAEHDYVGVPCGKMDQFVASLGRHGQALLLDTKTMAYRHYPLPQKTAIMLVNCGKKHDLANGSGYKQRVAECAEARKLLGVPTLCELGYQDIDRLSVLPDLIRRRARHVITENLRVLEFVAALEKGDTERQADLVAASHVSQRDDFEVSIPEIDTLVESSKRYGIRAARIVGGGFGGSVIALVPRDQAVAWWSFVAKENPDSQLISSYALKNNENEYAA
ncbi:MAG: galactokinase [Alphaproteobacteria bacterium]|nr:galactokinase [Alphaproteobacteria bacterium]MDE2492493.1 galactokinase [Alphaproteobacteria bacterium]